MGATISGAVQTPGQRSVYDFTVAAPTQVLIDSLLSERGLDWTLTGAQGEVGRGDFADTVQRSLGSAGMTLAFDGDMDDYTRLVLDKSREGRRSERMASTALPRAGAERNSSLKISSDSGPRYPALTAA